VVQVNNENVVPSVVAVAVVLLTYVPAAPDPVAVIGSFAVKDPLTNATRRSVLLEALTTVAVEELVEPVITSPGRNVPPCVAIVKVMVSAVEETAAFTTTLLVVPTVQISPTALVDPAGQ